MFDQQSGAAKAPPAGPAGQSDAAEMTAATLLAEVRGLRADLGVARPDGPDRVRIELLRALEELKNAAAAAQARISVDFDASQRAAQAAAGVRASGQGRGIGGQVGLARRESAHRGARLLGLAKVLGREMPHTLAAMAAGIVSEWRATLLARETACLSREHRSRVDAALAHDRLSELEGWGDARLVAEVRKLAYRLEPRSVLARIANAEKDRTVTSRPAPDTMAYLTALLPAAQAVACHAALTRAAATARANGDPRTRGQVMADTLVALVTGKKNASATGVEIELVVTDQTLFANTPGAEGGEPGQEPGWLRGYGPVPAGWVRNLIAGLHPDAKAWVRRLYRHPGTGQLVTLDARHRTFRHGLRRFTVYRDQWCRTPWCGAPIRHLDHPVPVAEGGQTNARNSQGLCEACNYAKQAPGWTAQPVPDSDRHTVVTTTPTGHVYHSTAPPLPGTPDPDPAPTFDDPPDAPPDEPPTDPLTDADLQCLWNHLAEEYVAA